MIGLRWIFLGFSSLSFFASEIIVDQASVLVARLSGYAESCHDGTDLSCKTFSASQFNGLYVAHFWGGGTAAVFSGFFIGRFGIWNTSLLNATLLFFGMLLFTLGPYVSSSVGAFGLMITGRLIYSVGYCVNTVLSHQVKAHWFYGRELALSFTIFTFCARLGAVLAYAIVGVLVESYGLQNALWVTFSLALLGPISAILAGYVYEKYALDAPDMIIRLQDVQVSQYGFSKIKKLEKYFWVLACFIFFFFGVIFTFLADFPKFLTELYNYSEERAGLITGIIPDVALAAPLIGWMIDRWGGRDLFLLGSSTFLLISMSLTLATTLYVVGIVVLAAFAYCFMAGSVWASIAAVTSPEIVGVGMGFGVGIQYLSPGLWLLIAGFMLDQTEFSLKKRWDNLYILMLVGAVACFLCTVLSEYLDTTEGGAKRLRNKHIIPETHHVDVGIPREVMSENAPLIAVQPAASLSGSQKNYSAI